eukprot:1817130-Prymnesium_polylepis.1
MRACKVATVRVSRLSLCAARTSVGGNVSLSAGSDCHSLAASQLCAGVLTNSVHGLSIHARPAGFGARRRRPSARPKNRDSLRRVEQRC